MSAARHRTPTVASPVSGPLAFTAAVASNSAVAPEQVDGTAKIAARKQQIARALIWCSRTALLGAMLALFPPWHVRSDLRVAGVYAAFAAIMVGVVLARRFERFVSLIIVVLVAAVVVPIMLGSDFGWGALFGIIAAAIEYVHHLVAARLGGAPRA
jgi:hypothetical protein